MSDNKIKCKIWEKIDGFVYPENQVADFKDKLDIGIAMPGGGNRACTYTLGCLRGLQLCGILDKVKYVSSNSGSGWIMPLLYNKNDSKDKFNISNYIGEYIEPGDLTLKNLDHIDKNILYFVHKNCNINQ